MLAVTGLGMVSALGHDVVQSCAASRAGIVRISDLEELQVYDEKTAQEEQARGHMIPWVTAGFTGLGRRVALGVAGLRDLSRQAAEALAELPRSALLLVTSSHFHRHLLEEQGQVPAEREALLASYTERLVPGIFKALGLRATPAVQRVLFGEAGLLQALRDAADLLRTGAVERCIVGAVDSLVEPREAWALWRLRLLRTPANPVGVLPGEAAAFVMLERPGAAARREARIHALLEAPVSQQEPFHRRSGRPALGRALGQSVSGTLDAVADRGAHLGLVVGALNGDAYRAQDWGHALIQLRSPERPVGAVPLWMPAASFGELGAATGLAGLCMAVRGFARGYCRTDQVLVWTAGDDGTRGAFFLRAPVKPGLRE